MLLAHLVCSSTSILPLYFSGIQIYEMVGRSLPCIHMRNRRLCAGTVLPSPASLKASIHNALPLDKSDGGRDHSINMCDDLQASSMSQASISCSHAAKSTPRPLPSFTAGVSLRWNTQRFFYIWRALSSCSSPPCYQDVAAALMLLLRYWHYKEATSTRRAVGYSWSAAVDNMEAGV